MNTTTTTPPAAARPTCPTCRTPLVGTPPDRVCPRCPLPIELPRDRRPIPYRPTGRD